MNKLFFKFLYKIFFIFFVLSFLTNLTIYAAAVDPEDREFRHFRDTEGYSLSVPHFLTLKKGLGCGSFGRVYCAFSTGGANLALKVCPMIGSNFIELLRDVRPFFFNHPCIIKCSGGYVCKKKYTSVFEFMPMNLQSLIFNEGIENKIDSNHVKFFLAQILAGLSYLSQYNVVHGDLKLANILVNKDSEIKIIDFGSSYTIGSSADCLDYVTTRYYRSPEHVISVFLGKKKQAPYERFGTKIDVWAAGVIFAETMQRSFLFESPSGLPLLRRIVGFLDLYAERLNIEDDRFEKNVPESLAGGELFAKLRDKWKPSDAGFVRFVEKFKIDDRQAYEVLIALLQPNPEHRGFAQDILKMPYFDEWRSEDFMKINPPSEAELNRHNKFEELLKLSTTSAEKFSEFIDTYGLALEVEESE